MLVFSDRTKNVRKLECFQCPETQVFQCRRTVAEESKRRFAQHEIDFTFGPSLGVSRVSNDDHFVVRVHALQKEHFERTLLDKSLHVVVLKWNV